MDLIDRGDYWEIKDYKSQTTTDETGKVTGYIHCPYIPKIMLQMLNRRSPAAARGNGERDSSRCH